MAKSVEDYAKPINAYYAEYNEKLVQLYSKFSDKADGYLNQSAVLKYPALLAKYEDLVSLAGTLLETGLTVQEKVTIISEIKENRDIFEYYSNIFDVIQRRSGDPWLKTAAAELKSEIESDFTLYLNNISDALSETFVSAADFTVNLLGIVKDPTGIIFAVKSGPALANIIAGTGDRVERAYRVVQSGYLAKLFVDELIQNRSDFNRVYGSAFALVDPYAKEFRKNYETLVTIRRFGEDAYLEFESHDGALLKGLFQFINDYKSTEDFYNESIERISGLMFDAYWTGTSGGGYSAFDGEGVYLDFMQSDEWAKGTDGYGEAYDISGIGINAYKIFDFDGNGTPELWLEALDYSGIRPWGISALYTIEDSTVRNLLLGYQSGGTIGGEYLVIRFDTQTARHVIALEGYAGGFGGSAASSRYYDYQDGELTEIGSTSIINDGESGTTEYKINGTVVSAEAYEAVSARFEAPADNSYTME